jgi:hypothetical protein
LVVVGGGDVEVDIVGVGVGGDVEGDGGVAVADSERGGRGEDGVEVRDEA